MRIHAFYDLGERMDARDYFGRQWVGEYCGLGDYIADRLLEILDGAEVPKDA